ncbi:hypothetical protein [Streptomyces sp. NPDC001435]|uniref:hypothetical protein n=1 Tax=Streptomyces sp. NPDC001435 TaxID=3364576 RepID=UPI0036794A72
MAAKVNANTTSPGVMKNLNTASDALLTLLARCRQGEAGFDEASIDRVIWVAKPRHAGDRSGRRGCALEALTSPASTSHDRPVGAASGWQSGD